MVSVAAVDLRVKGVSMLSTPKQPVDSQISQSVPDLRGAVLQARPANAAVQRLQGRLLAKTEASEIITSYDRMHNRHNRS